MTPPTPGANNPYSEEEPYADALLRGIELAVEDVFDDPGRNITRTEQEKLCYFAIKEFDLPVTYSWYLAGAYTKVAGEPDNAPGRMTTNTGGVRRDHGETEEVQQYRDYFASEVFSTITTCGKFGIPGNSTFSATSTRNALPRSTPISISRLRTSGSTSKPWMRRLNRKQRTIRCRISAEAHREGCCLNQTSKSSDCSSLTSISSLRKSTICRDSGLSHSWNRCY